MALKKNPKYDLKRKYDRTLKICMIISFLFLIGAFKFFPKFNKENIKIEAPQELVTVEDVISTKQQTQPPPPPKPPIPIEAPAEDVLEDIEIADTEIDMEENLAPPPPPVEETAEEEEPVFFIAVEEEPVPIGGISGIEARLDYPQIAIHAGVEGRVYIRAYINENGDVEKVELLKGIGAGCDEEALKAVKETKFKPGKQRGRPVKTQMSVPILFKIRD
jgi:periplasmic protein TonB